MYGSLVPHSSATSTLNFFNVAAAAVQHGYPATLLPPTASNSTQGSGLDTSTQFGIDLTGENMKSLKERIYKLVILIKFYFIIIVFNLDIQFFHLLL